MSRLIGGVLVLLGLFTRLGAFLITCVMLVAIFGVLWPKFFAPEGMELATAFLAIALALLMTGRGRLSIDRRASLICSHVAAKLRLIVPRVPLQCSPKK